MKSIPGNERGFVSIIGLVITLLIISLLMYRISKTYFAPKPRDEYNKQLAEQGIDRDKPVSVIDAAKQRTEESNKRSKEIEERAVSAE